MKFTRAEHDFYNEITQEMLKFKKIIKDNEEAMGLFNDMIATIDSFFMEQNDQRREYDK